MISWSKKVKSVSVAQDSCWPWRPSVGRPVSWSMCEFLTPLKKKICEFLAFHQTGKDSSTPPLTNALHHLFIASHSVQPGENNPTQVLSRCTWAIKALETLRRIEIRNLHFQKFAAQYFNPQQSPDSQFSPLQIPLGSELLQKKNGALACMHHRFPLPSFDPCHTIDGINKTRKKQD